MKTKYFIFAASALVALASCSNEEYIGDNNGLTAAENDGSINFGGGFKAVTRADKYNKDAADLLGAQFIVTGVKGDGTGTGQSDVFKSYTVNWEQNTAGKTESNTADWEYVGKTNLFGLVGPQSIKYWDYSTTAYDFAAYSVGNGNTIITSGDPAANQILATAISYNATQIGETGKYQITSAYTLKGTREALAKCYITDMKTVAKANYKQEVELQFRSLSSKVRMAIYETVPGYSVKDVYFFHDNSTSRGTDISANTAATLFGDDIFYGGGTYTISFPHIGSGNSGDTDYNKAHVTIEGATATKEDTQGFGPLNYTNGEAALAGGSAIYLKRTAQNPSFAGTDTYYQTMLPNENGVVLEMRVNYTLVSNDGSNEEIKVYGARAFVPAIYTKWLPNYAYTYIFKISDNSNGWTNPTTDPEGLFPITFDAVVLDDEATGKQTTITTVATPSITTYQKGHVYSASDEYKTGDIYAQVNNEGTLITDLNHQTASVDDKSFFYKLTGVANPTEALVEDALNIRASVETGVITGRNDLVLTPATIDNTVTTIPGEDGNDIEINAGEAAKLSPAAAGNYAYVYLVSTGTPTDVITTVVLSTAPADWVASDANVYYTDAACTVKDEAAFSTAVALTEEPADWNATNNVYYTDAACTTPANIEYADNTYYKKQVRYKKYTNLNNTYGVKVIKVAAP